LPHDQRRYKVQSRFFFTLMLWHERASRPHAGVTTGLSNVGKVLEKDIDMNDPPGLVCLWCGGSFTEQRNKYCSIGCYYKAHDVDTLYEMAVNDREVLKRASERLTFEIKELERPLRPHGASGSISHPEVQATLVRLRSDFEGTTQQIEAVSARIQELGRLMK
jgi:hypothetical protein